MKKDKIRLTNTAFFLTFMLILLNGCKETDSGIAPDNRVTVFNDEFTLNQRIISYNDTLEVVGVSASSDRKEKGFELILEKSMESPAVDGNTLQATSICYTDGKLLVSYNFRGENYFGGAEFLTEKFKLTSQVLYNNADINAVISDGENVYLTGGVSENDIPAQVMKIGINGSKFESNEIQSQVLGSFTGTSLHLSNEDLYVTTGDDETAGGGIYHLDDQLNLKDYLPLHDARWIVEYEGKLFVVQGTPGTITVLDSENLEKLFSFTFSGADVKASKTTMEIVDGRVFIAGGTQGVQIHNALDGSFLHKINFEEGNITNAVTAEDGLLFISNGEGGLHVASYSDNLYEAPELIGEILVDNNNESVNHVLHRNKKLFVATGLGGVKMISVKDK